MTDKEDLGIIDLFQGSAGKVLYMNNNRITPPELSGKMSTICSIKLPRELLLSSIKTLLKELED